MEESKELGYQAAEQQIKLATIWQTKGKLSQAIANCEKVIQLQPDYMPAYLTLMQLVQTGQRQQAINADLRRFVGYKCQQRAIAMFPEKRMLDSYVKLIESVIRSPTS